MFRPVDELRVVWAAQLGLMHALFECAHEPTEDGGDITGLECHLNNRKTVSTPRKLQAMPQLARRSRKEPAPAPQLS